MKEKLLKIINTFGVNPQLKKLNEECYELIEAIREYDYEEHKYFEDVKKQLKDHIEEELADVCTLLRQFAEYYNIDRHDIADISDYKIDRTIERIESKYYKK